MIVDLFINNQSVKGLHFADWPEFEFTDHGEILAIIDMYMILKYHKFDGSEWMCWGIDIDVNKALDMETKRDSQVPYEVDLGMKDWTETDHLQRIRNLMEVRGSDPININFEKHDYCIVMDGNHRLMAAYLNGDQFIYAIIEGNMDMIYRFCEWSGYEY